MGSYHITLSLATSHTCGFSQRARTFHSSRAHVLQPNYGPPSLAYSCYRLQRRKDKLREDEAKLRKSLKDYDKYLRENDLRRKRAQKKAKHELEECTALEQELTRLRALNATARELRERQRAQVKADEVYETYVVLI